MVSVTLSVPQDVRKKMNTFPEMNWSGFIRKCLEEKTAELEWRESALKELEKEKEFSGWAVDLQASGRGERLKELEKKGLI
jgi:hypothetical protein